jgi:hypothetical protein
MAEEQRYTTDQVSTAARELRQAAGADEELLSGAQVISMLAEEIRLLRERGFTDESIAGLLFGFDICVTPEQIAHNAPSTIWGAARG